MNALLEENIRQCENPDCKAKFVQHQSHNPGVTKRRYCSERCRRRSEYLRRKQSFPYDCLLSNLREIYRIAPNSMKLFRELRVRCGQPEIIE